MKGILQCCLNQKIIVGVIVKNMNSKIYKTTDEGKIFNKIKSDIQNIAAITFDATNLLRVLASTESGVLYGSTDDGTTWQKN